MGNRSSPIKNPNLNKRNPLGNQLGNFGQQLRPNQNFFPPVLRPNFFSSNPYAQPLNQYSSQALCNQSCPRPVIPPQYYSNNNVYQNPIGQQYYPQSCVPQYYPQQLPVQQVQPIRSPPQFGLAQQTNGFQNCVSYPPQFNTNTACIPIASPRLPIVSYQEQPRLACIPQSFPQVLSANQPSYNIPYQSYQLYATPQTYQPALSQPQPQPQAQAQQYYQQAYQHVPQSQQPQQPQIQQQPQVSQIQVVAKQQYQPSQAHQQPQLQYQPQIQNQTQTLSQQIANSPTKSSLGSSSLSESQNFYHKDYSKNLKLESGRLNNQKYKAYNTPLSIQFNTSLMRVVPV